MCGHSLKNKRAKCQIFNQSKKLMLIFVFFLVTKSKFPDSKISEISDSQFVNLCENSTQNICIFENFQENSSYQIKADGNNTLYVVSENTQSNRITRIVQLDTYGNIIFQSLVNTILEIESELNVYGHLDISRYHLFTKNIILHEDAVLIAGIIEAQSITYKCGTGFSCPSISAKFIQATNDNLNIAFDEPNEEDKKNPPLNNESIILTAYSYRCPSVNFDLLNNSHEFGSVFLTCNTETITSTNRNNLNTFSASNSLSTISYYTARFIGCRSPRYISNGECNLCPGTNSAAITDGSFTCQTREAGSEYISSTRECKLCEPGTYYDNETKTCRACPIGSYQNDYGKLNCIKCPENSTTILTGQSTLKSCVCPAGYHGHYGEICVECDEFEDSPFGSISSNAEPGYWQDINKLITPLQCLPSYACLGNNTCSKEYEGKFCGSCANGYFRLHQGCFKCHTSLPVILGILMLVYVIFIFYVTIYHESLLSVLIITFVFLQEVSLFAFFNTTEKFSSAEFVSYLSFFLFKSTTFPITMFWLS
ncbi:hypothetical protein TRFO_12339 [Tritrichomonas foetus]|uniref:Tyrosine-protein kinase ephrin type A/B receptor-like domain-containing protein n=1 Tax=Tritrichomonas foetus TaxID=1144522 RepID=A0A1J4J1Y6_9EUKA|nr:hypothetical protein TRFO_12339 [Tritrichomonas foetus]|eukprot:OHS92777.1 hypothetical protein TRFO_12339 [Tritrichomonas foetus]